MDGMKKNPSHSSHISHPCAPLTLPAIVQDVNVARLGRSPLQLPRQ